MAYTITVEFADQAEKQRMHQFLQQNQLLVNQALNFKEDEKHLGENLVLDARGVDFTPNKEHLLGFMGKGHPDAALSLAAWMASKSSMRDKNDQPYLFIDSEQVSIGITENATSHIRVDSHGITQQDGFGALWNKLWHKKSTEQTEQAFMQLDQAWHSPHKKLRM